MAEVIITITETPTSMKVKAMFSPNLPENPADASIVQVMGLALMTEARRLKEEVFSDEEEE